MLEGDCGALRLPVIACVMGAFQVSRINVLLHKFNSVVSRVLVDAQHNVYDNLRRNG